MVLTQLQWLQQGTYLELISFLQKWIRFLNFVGLYWLLGSHCFRLLKFVLTHSATCRLLLCLDHLILFPLLLSWASLDSACLMGRFGLSVLCFDTWIRFIVELLMRRLSYSLVLKMLGRLTGKRVVFVRWSREFMSLVCVRICARQHHFLSEVVWRWHLSFIFPLNGLSACHLCILPETVMFFARVQRRATISGFLSDQLPQLLVSIAGFLARCRLGAALVLLRGISTPLEAFKLVHIFKLQGFTVTTLVLHHRNAAIRSWLLKSLILLFQSWLVLLGLW